jgi:hypothetical protein
MKRNIFSDNVGFRDSIKNLLNTGNIDLTKNIDRAAGAWFG